MFPNIEQNDSFIMRFICSFAEFDVDSVNKFNVGLDHSGKKTPKKGLYMLPKCFQCLRWVKPYVITLLRAAVRGNKNTDCIENCPENRERYCSIKIGVRVVWKVPWSTNIFFLMVIIVCGHEWPHFKSIYQLLSDDCLTMKITGTGFCVSDAMSRSLRSACWRLTWSGTRRRHAQIVASLCPGRERSWSTWKMSVLNDSI